MKFRLSSLWEGLGLSAVSFKSHEVSFKFYAVGFNL